VKGTGLCRKSRLFSKLLYSKHDLQQR